MIRKDILIIGLGGMGKKHLNIIEYFKNSIVYCYDSNEDQLNTLKLDKKIKKILNLNEVKEKIKLAIIATPTDTHLRYAKWCVKNGIHFLIEKPIANKITGIKKLILDCERKKIIAGVAFPRRHSAAIIEIKERVRNGEIGDLRIIRSNFAQDFRKYRPDYKSIYYSNAETGGGILMDALSHHINLLCFFGGRVEKVQAIYDRLVFDDVSVEDSAIINLRFKNGILGSVTGNQFQKPNEDFIELVGTSGNIKYERITGKLEWFNSKNEKWKSKKIDGNWNKILMNQEKDFIKCINGKSNIKTNLNDGLHHLEIILAAKKSFENNMTVRLKN